MRKVRIAVLFGAFSLANVSVGVNAALAAIPQASVGVGHGITLPRTGPDPCPGASVLSNDDGSFENAYAWQYGGVSSPDFGTFVEGYNGAGYVWAERLLPRPTLCGVELGLTQVGKFANQPVDCYIFDDHGNGLPGNVLSMEIGAHISPPAIWPNVSLHDIGMVSVVVDGGFYVGLRGRWPGRAAGWFVAADLDGFGGVPFTKIAPGIGYPTGWQSVSTVWGPTQALGIRPLWTGYIPVQPSTWGRVKALYR